MSFHGTVFELINSNGNWTTKVLHNFNGSDGYAPGALMIDKLGRLFGIAAGGGDTKCNPPTGCGVVFQLTPPAQKGGAWSYKSIFTFHGGNSGANPFLALARDFKGNLYGIALYTGQKTCPSGVTCDMVFELSPPAEKGGDWTETVIHNFVGNPDGAWIDASLTVGEKGVLYGTSRAGGNGPCNVGNNLIGCGTVFMLTPPTVSGGHWTETILHRFQGGSDGTKPSGSVILDSSGALYSTTETGGDQSQGTFFKLVR